MYGFYYDPTYVMVINRRRNLYAGISECQQILFKNIPDIRSHTWYDGT